MRRFLSSLIVSIIFMFVGMVSVNALNAEIKKGSNNTYTFSWQDVSNYSDYILKYSNAKLTSAEDVESSGKLRASSGSVTFQTTVNSGTITFSIVKNDYGNEVLISKSIDIGMNNSTTTNSTQQQTTAPVTTQTPKSNNNNLSSLNITGDDGDEVVLSPSFSSSVYTYEATVASTVRTVSIDATLEDSKANMVISNNADEELVAGENNRITITVTAEDGSKRAYTINIAREALTADATLKELTIKEVKSFKLEDDKFTYNIKIKKGVKELTIDYALSDENASVEIDGNENLKDGSKVKITVTAEDGTKKVYTLNISVEDEDTKTDTSSISVEKNPLIIMGLSIIAFGLIGGIIYVIKK